jgi:hypothetical protein
MARADIDAAVADLTTLYGSTFGGKRLGRFVLNRDQVADLLRLRVAQDRTIASFATAALNDADLVLAQCGRSHFSVVAARKASRWRKVPRLVLSDLVGAADDTGKSVQDLETEEDD